MQPSDSFVTIAGTFSSGLLKFFCSSVFPFHMPCAEATVLGEEHTVRAGGGLVLLRWLSFGSWLLCVPGPSAVTRFAVP